MKRTGFMHILRLAVLTITFVPIIDSASVQTAYRPPREILNFIEYIVKTISRSGTANQESSKWHDISVLSWNILSPIRIDETVFAESGADVNLLRTDVRTYVIARRILRINADIVHVQEIQVDTYAVLKDYLKHVYDVTKFAAHGHAHWPDVAPGKTNIPNGGAIFYKKEKFYAQRVVEFETSDTGNIAQAAVLRLIRYPDSNPIMSVNVHFQHGFSVNDSNLRVSEGGEVHENIKQISAKLAEEDPSAVPMVIVGGDFNSLTGFPGVEVFQSRGYSNVRTVTNNTENSIYYREIIITEFFPPLVGLPIDTFMVPTELLESDLMEIKSFDVASIADDENSERGYLTKVLRDHLQDTLEGRISTEMSKNILETLVAMMGDDLAYDTSFNRALRIGADHLPIYGNVRIRNTSNRGRSK